MDSDARPFSKSLLRTLGFSLGLVVFASLGLFITSQVTAQDQIRCAPATDAATAEPQDGLGDGFECELTSEGGLSPGLSAAVSGVFSAVLAVGAVSLLADFALRRRFGADLLSFLGLKGSLVSTGLTDAGQSTSVDLRARLDGQDELRYIGRSPTLFLSEQVPALLRIAERRRLKVTIGLPDPANEELMDTVAASLGLESDALGEAIRAFTRSLEANWQTVVKRLVDGTSFRVVYVNVPIPFEACAATSFSFMSVGRPFQHRIGDDHYLAVFDSGKQFPDRWISESLVGLEAVPAAWEDTKR